MLEDIATLQLVIKSQEKSTELLFFDERMPKNEIFHFLKKQHTNFDQSLLQGGFHFC